MKKYIYGSHSVFSFREWNMNNFGICIVQKTGAKLTARERWQPYNWRFRINIGKPCWHWMIRIPFLLFCRDNCGFKLGTPNLFLWIIN